MIVARGIEPRTRSMWFGVERRVETPSTICSKARSSSGLESRLRCCLHHFCSLRLGLRNQHEKDICS
jgi:hypothetical protein